jgi:ribonuclease T2
MATRQIGIGAAVALALLTSPAASHAQSFWDSLRGPAATRQSPPCVLDKCLNGAAQKPGATPSQADAAPTQTAPPASAGSIAPGNFDFYVLALSWSPGFCDTGGAAKAPEQCAAGANLGFVVHGLWPQNQRGYPSDCDSNRPVSRIALQGAGGLFPSEDLARHEWRKHGTCTGLSPEAYFASVKRARGSVVIPDAFKSPRQEQSVAPTAIQRAFIAANPGLRPQAMALGCAHDELQEVRLCLAKDLRAFVDCQEVARATCRAQSIAVAPIR